VPLIRTGDLVAAAYRTGTAMLAFNVITLEHAEAIAMGAEAAGSPVIMQISENTVMFHGGRIRPLVAAACAIATESTTSIAVHLDHVEDPELLRAGIDSGVSSAMFDASKLPYEDNVAATKAAADLAHARGVFLEAEHSKSLPVTVADFCRVGAEEGRRADCQSAVDNREMERHVMTLDAPAPRSARRRRAEY